MVCLIAPNAWGLLWIHTALCVKSWGVIADLWTPVQTLRMSIFWDLISLRVNFALQISVLTSCLCDAFTWVFSDISRTGLRAKWVREEEKNTANQGYSSGRRRHQSQKHRMDREGEGGCGKATPPAISGWWIFKGLVWQTYRTAEGTSLQSTAPRGAVTRGQLEMP